MVHVSNQLDHGRDRTKAIDIGAKLDRGFAVFQISNARILNFEFKSSTDLERLKDLSELKGGSYSRVYLLL